LSNCGTVFTEAVGKPGLRANLSVPLPVVAIAERLFTFCVSATDMDRCA